MQFPTGIIFEKMETGDWDLDSILELKEKEDIRKPNEILLYEVMH